MAWPKSVPVLTAKNMYKGNSNAERDKRHCVGIWVGIVFRKLSAAERDSIFKSIAERCTKVCGKKCIHTLDTIIECNDVHLTTKQTAQIFNAEMRRLGYTEVTECRYWDHEKGTR